MVGSLVSRARFGTLDEREGQLDRQVTLYLKVEQCFDLVIEAPRAMRR